VTKNRDIRHELEHRILLLDGGFGTMIQQYGLDEADYRGKEFAASEKLLRGCNDLLNLTRPETIREIHEKYLQAGSDVITSNTFNANSISLADYGLAAEAYRINRVGAAIAREAADAFTARNPQKPRFVGGSMGPTSHTLSMSADVDNPGARAFTFEQLSQAYYNQARGLMDGGADLLMLETVFDALNAKAAIFAIETLFAERGMRLPVIVSSTLTSSGRTLAGQTIEAFYTSVAHAEPLAVSLNCSFGAKALLPYLERLAAVSEFRVAVYPNAGLPNVMGGYDETPAMFAADVEEYMRRGLVNLVGGCCGTTPLHIFELAKIVNNYTPRPLPQRRHVTCLSGLEQLRIVPEANFVNVGERTNVAGSAKFARLIREKNYEEALSVARAQVEAGANIVDVCMDDGLIDGPEAMRDFLNLMGSEPEIAAVPVMIDSSKWEVLETGLRVVQVNSISLKEGEQEFLHRARLIRRYGAAAVVMLFDEQGQADTYARKIDVAQRAYKLLTDDGFPAEDIIFDPNILAVATGIEAHDAYARDFIEAVRWIKRNLPHAKISGGVSNLSFAFRGNNAVREAMHSVFLYHAIQAGMDMAIVNPQMLQIYSDIEPGLLERVEDVILCRRADAAERLTEYASQFTKTGATQTQHTDAWRSEPLGKRIEYAMLKGVADYIEQDALEGYRTLGSPLAVIDQLLMPAMEVVGNLFGQGKMFLPQVVKTARVMKKAVAVLTPYIEQGSEANAKSAGKVLVATVKGDVHDIGKNIVAVVMACNGYTIRDLGVMVECPRIIDEAVAWGADAICLSGLITPSLEEMIHVCEELERRGLQIPVLIGGATTSDVHTAVKIAPTYSGPVIHADNASRNNKILGELLGPGREEYLARVREEQQTLRDQYRRREEIRTILPFGQVRKLRVPKPASEIAVPAHTGRLVFPDISIADVEPLIDWNFFFPAWGLKGRVPEIFENPEHGAEARKLYDDAQKMLARIREEKLLTLQGVAGIFEAVSRGDDIVVTGPKDKKYILPMLRSQAPVREAQARCLADFIADEKAGRTDYIGAFALTGGIGLKELTEKFRAEGDDYNAILSKLLADRLTEALCEWVHIFIRRQMWGYETGPALTPEQIIRSKYRGRRMAFGYPACPDHSLKREVFDLLAADKTTAMRLNDNYMITPEEALCGLFFADAEYFSVGRIDREQLADYAARRNMDIETIEKLIPNNI
jgi:5-methyltetrahydrofolate--homocysteine methyltransferase